MRLILLAPAFLLLFAGCAPAASNLTNPLTASRYGDELADTMANLIINEDPTTKNEAMRKLIEKEIGRGKNIATEAREIQAKGWAGGFVSIRADVRGYVLYLPDTVYISPDFETEPGPALRVYLTTVVDPRDAEFPDATAVDVGPLQSAYGAQEYRVPPQKEEGKLRTFVLYDTRLNMIYGFAQIVKL